MTDRPIIYRLRMTGDGTFLQRITEDQAKKYLRGDDWKGVLRGVQYITASKPDPTMHEVKVIDFDAEGPVCRHPRYGIVRIYEPVIAAA